MYLDQAWGVRVGSLHVGGVDTAMGKADIQKLACTGELPGEVVVAMAVRAMVWLMETAGTLTLT